MTDVVIVDTTVLLNLLNIPGKNQQREETVTEFHRLLDCNAEFLIPLATIFETSNHIKRTANGRRRQWAKKLLNALKLTMDGSEFWIGAIRFPESKEFLAWIDEYPDCAARGKDLNDLSIIKEWERMRAINPRGRVRIWSFDNRLMGYDNNPSPD